MVQKKSAPAKESRGGEMAERAMEISPILPYFKIKLVAESRIYESALEAFRVDQYVAIYLQAPTPFT